MSEIQIPDSLKDAQGIRILIHRLEDHANFKRKNAFFTKEEIEGILVRFEHKINRKFGECDIEMIEKILELGKEIIQEVELGSG